MDTHKERLRELFEANKLVQEDTFIMTKGSKKIPIITRTGVEKIQANNNILVTYEIVNISQDQKYCAVKAIGEMIGSKGEAVRMESYAEANPENCKNQYPLMTCEKRALGRVVLKLAGFYKEGIYTEDENLDVIG